MDIGKRLRDLREARGFTSQDSFAEALGISKQRVSDVENNRHKLRRSSLMFFLSGLGVTEQEFFPSSSVRLLMAGGSFLALGRMNDEEATAGARTTPSTKGRQPGSGKG